ncbi:MAG: type II toxin-antitoxin system VapC family toxin [Methanobrevibacter sp.]|nr:type II toxin-antitoxin system VapC family toxin [Methanobrevibacter sp.]
MIFLDANYLVSYYIDTEKHHKRALEIDKELGNRTQIISKLVIAEVINVLYTKLKIDKKIIKEIYEKLKSEYTLIDDSYIFDKAIDRIMKAEKRFPFFDYAIITLMEDLGIKEIVTFDKHFNNIARIVRIC